MSYHIDPPFRLTPEQRANVRKCFDVEALERLVSLVPPAERERFLAVFSAVRPGEPASFLVEMGDPELQRLLDEVYAPEWESWSNDELLAWSQASPRAGSELPGRVTVMRRRGLL